MLQLLSFLYCDSFYRKTEKLKRKEEKRHRTSKEAASIRKTRQICALINSYFFPNNYFCNGKHVLAVRVGANDACNNDRANDSAKLAPEEKGLDDCANGAQRKQNIERLT